MGRLDDVRKEIEQLCEDIERDSLRSRHHPTTDDEVTSAPPVQIQLILSGDVSRIRLNISLQQDDSQECR